MTLVLCGHNLSRDSVGQKVMYIPTGEPGVITSLGEELVFVRFLGDVDAKGCCPRDLRWLSARVGREAYAWGKIPDCLLDDFDVIL